MTLGTAKCWFIAFSNKLAWGQLGVAQLFLCQLGGFGTIFPFVTEEQRQKTAASFSSEGSSGSQPYPSQQHRETPSSSYQPVPGVTTHGGGVPAANQPLPLPMGYPSTKADVSYLDEINKWVVDKCMKHLGGENHQNPTICREIEQRFTCSYIAIT